MCIITFYNSVYEILVTTENLSQKIKNVPERKCHLICPLDIFIICYEKLQCKPTLSLEMNIIFHIVYKTYSLELKLF